MVIDRETGEVCMQLNLGKHSITRKLPDQLATFDQNAMHLYFDSIVPDMVQELYALRRKHNRKLKRKAECGTQQKQQKT